MARRCSTPRQGAAPLHPVERHAQPRRGGEARRRSALPQDHRQHRLSRLHRAEARLGEEQRAGDLRQGAQGAAAEGLSAALADRRAHVGNVGFGRHVLARCRASGAGRPNCSPPPISPRSRCRRWSKAPTRPACCAPNSPSQWGMSAGSRGRRRRRRQCGLGLRHGHGEARPGLRLARHVGRALRRQRLLSAQSRKRGAHLLPRAAEHLAPDGRHPVGDGFAELALRHHRQERRRPDRRTRRRAARRRPASPSCPISPASARRTTTRRSAAPSPGSATNRTAPR